MIGSVPTVNATKMVAPARRRNRMAKYLLLKHYRGAPAPVNDASVGPGMGEPWLVHAA